MTDYQKELIVEHKELCARIRKFNKFIKNTDFKDKHNYANAVLQQKSMMDYENALAARLCNENICVDGEKYFPIYFKYINTINMNSSISPVEDIPTTENKPGSDFDKDNEAINQTTGENDNLK